MRLLDTNDIPYEVIEYEPITRDAEEVAELIGVPEFMVYKTLIAQSNATKNPLIALIASDRRLDLKKLAAAAGEKKVSMAKHEEAERLTGLQVGGISPLMLTDKNWPVFLDQPATQLQNIVLSAGQRGTQLRIPVNALMGLLRPRLADISNDAED